MNTKLALLLMTFLLGSCAGAIKLDPTSFNVDTGPKETIPAVCKSSYASGEISVAVVNFTNNTTFEFAKAVQQNVAGSSNRTAVGGAAAGASPAGVGVVWGQAEKMNFQRESQTTERQINAKLSESVEDGVMDELVNMGGAKVFTRKDLEKIMSEQKFQQSGMVDDKNLAQIGKMAGVKYIVTGSVNNVDLSYKTFESARKGSEGQGFMGALGAAVLESQEGWNINTEVALRILDVESGGVLFSKVVSGKHIIGKIPYPNYDALIGGMKKAAAKGLADARPQLSKWFTVKGYIMQTKTSPDGKMRAALVNIGEKQGLKTGSVLLAYTFQEISDPFDEKKISCDVIKLPVELKVTEQLQADRAWVVVESKPEQLGRIKTGQLVERKPLAGQGLMTKMGY